jgi:hypothetical protein
MLKPVLLEPQSNATICATGEFKMGCAAQMDWLARSLRYFADVVETYGLLPPFKAEQT